MSYLPLHHRSATELGRMLRARTISSVELTSHFLNRLETQGAALNALAELTADLALAQARQADRELAAGQTRSTLHGVPYGAKDLLATAGIPTRWGSPAHSNQVFDYDATVVTRLQAAGAILIGKLAMVELAGGGGYSGANASLHGPGRCPWNPAHWAGGSSSGSGSAVGIGAVGFALGSETWGSITCPAAFCGITGLRPTYGRVSRHGAMALCWTLDKIGPMARSAEDCGHILAAIAGPDASDPTCTLPGFAFDPVAALSHPLRLGVLPHDTSKTTEVKAAFDAALAHFPEPEFVASEVLYPPDLPYDEITGLIVNAEGSAAFEGLIRSERLQMLVDPQQQAGLLAGLTLSAADYLRAQRLRTQAIRALNTLWKRFDVLIAPTLLTEALPVDRPFSDHETPWGGNGGPGNLAGWPSLSLPMGFGKQGLPLGLELIGPPGGEQTLLDLGTRFQQQTEWHLRVPPDPA